MSASAPPYDPSEHEKGAFAQGPPPAYHSVYPESGVSGSGSGSGKQEQNYRPLPAGQYGQGPPQGYPSHSPVMHQPAAQHTTIVVNTGNCPRCNVGSLVEEKNTCCFCCCALAVIFTFPFGLLFLCCFPKDKYYRCPNCGYKNG